MSESTTITAPLRRSYNADLFAGLDLPPVTAASNSRGVWSITFDGVLTAAQERSAWARMESTDDTDQARRAVLRDACAGGASNVDCLTAAYVLGDPMPAPAYPAPDPVPDPG